MVKMDFYFTVLLLKILEIFHRLQNNKTFKYEMIVFSTINKVNTQASVRESL